MNRDLKEFAMFITVVVVLLAILFGFGMLVGQALS